MKPNGLFGRIRNTRLRDFRRALLIVAGTVIGAFQLCGAFGIRFNLSTSLPIGIYVVSDANARWVEFCPDPKSGALALERGYRAEGVCSDHGVPLLKPIVAQAGDVVDVTTEGIRINGELLSNTAPLKFDTKGRTLPVFPFGHYAVVPGTIWVASSYNPRSFDSRYFGPIPTKAIRNHARPLFTMDFANRYLSKHY